MSAGVARVGVYIADVYKAGTYRVTPPPFSL